MRWRALAVVLLTVSVTASGYELTRLLVRPTFCDLWAGTWMGYFCADDRAGGGSSGAQ